jgi:hypothetical protein
MVADLACSIDFISPWPNCNRGSVFVAFEKEWSWRTGATRRNNPNEAS